MVLQTQAVYERSCLQGWGKSSPCFAVGESGFLPALVTPFKAPAYRGSASTQYRASCACTIQHDNHLWKHHPDTPKGELYQSVFSPIKLMRDWPYTI